MDTATKTRIGISGKVNADPFPHVVIDGIFEPPSDLSYLGRWNNWEVKYDNDCEQGKRTTRQLWNLPSEVKNLFHWLRSTAAIRDFSELFDIPELRDDETLHGGGLHYMEPGGRLACHLDYARHPILSEFERRVNVIAFLNSQPWPETWSGALCLCDPLGEVKKRIYPKPGRIVAFETSDISYHAVDPISGPEPRITAAVYYLAPIRPGVTRQRALFMPVRG